MDTAGCKVLRTLRCSAKKIVSRLSDEIAALIVCPVLGGSSAKTCAERVMSVYEDDPGHGRPKAGKLSSRAGGLDTGEMINSVLTGSVLPRLVHAHAGAGAVKVADESWPMSVGKVGLAEIDELYLAVLGRGSRPPEAVVSDARSRGLDQSDINEGLLRPVALKLGEGWLADECSFFDVSLGMARLHQVLRSSSARWGGASVSRGSGRTILLAGAPGEQHLFGLGVIEQAFAASGWTVTMMAGESWNAVCDVLQTEHHDVLGITCAGERLRLGLKSAIEVARSVSTNRDVKVLVGGHLFENDSTEVDSVGADAFALDSMTATNVADNLLPVFGKRIEPSG